MVLCSHLLCRDRLRCPPSFTIGHGWLHSFGDGFHVCVNTVVVLTGLILATEAPVFKGKTFTRKVHRITERKDFVLYVRKKHVFTSLFNERIKKKGEKKRKG